MHKLTGEQLNFKKEITSIEKRQEYFITENRMNKLEIEVVELKKFNKNEINDVKDELRRLAELAAQAA